MQQISTNFKHIQEVASNLWTIKHNLSSYPVIDIFVSKNGEIVRILPLEIIYEDGNNCTISFTDDFTGFALVLA